MTDGITNDPATWLVDWAKPIEWDDGTPAELWDNRWGQATVLLDPEHLPQGFKADSLRRVWLGDPLDSPYDWSKTVIAAHVMSATGEATGGSTCRIVNVNHRLEAEAMQSSATWGMF